MPVPGFALRLGLGVVADIIVHGQRVVPQKALDLGYQFRFPTLEVALRDLLLPWLTGIGGQLALTLEGSYAKPC